MDGKIDELEIIIRASVENAREGIRSFAKDVKKSMQNSASDIERASTTAQNLAKEIKPGMEQVTTIIHGLTRETKNFDFSGMFKSLDVNELKTKMSEVQNEINIISSAMEKTYDIDAMGIAVEFDGTQEQADKLAELQSMYNELSNNIQEKTPRVNFDISEVVQQMEKLDNMSFFTVKDKINEVLKDIRHLKDELILDKLGYEFDIETNTEEVKIKLEGLKEQYNSLITELEGKNKDGFGLLSVREQVKILSQEFSQQLPKISQGFEDIRAVSLQLQQSIYPITDKFVSGFNKISSVGKKAFELIKSGANNFATNVSSELKPYTSMLSKVGIVGKQAFNDIKSRVGDLASKFEKPIGAAKKFINMLKGAKKEASNVKSSGNGLADGFTKGFEKGLSSIKRFAFSLIGIQSIWRGVSKAAASYMAYDEQLQQSFQNSWNTLGSLLAPVLELVASLFSKVTSYAAAFVKVLTGIDLVARANAKALDKQASSTKKAAQESKQLAGMDSDITNLTSDKNSGEDDSPSLISTEPVDTSIFDGLFPILEKIRKIAGELFQPISNAWSKYGKGFTDSFMSALYSIGDLAVSVGSSIFEVWTNGTGEEIVGNYLILYTELFDIIGMIAETLRTAWDSNGIGTATVQAVADAFIILQQIVIDVFQTFKKFWDSHGQPICDVFMMFINDIANLFKDLTEVIKQIWDNGLSFAFEKFLEFGAKVIEIAGWIWSDFVQPFISWFIQKIVPALDPLFKAFGNIISIATEVMDFIKNVFTGNFDKAFGNIKNIIKSAADFIVNLFSFGGKIFDGIVDGLANIFKGVVNMLISGINAVINAPIKFINDILNGIRNFDIPVVGKPFKGLWSNNPIPSPTIPKLATGHVATSPILAEIGEYADASTDPEIVSPVSMMKESFRSVLSEFADMFGGTRVDRLVVNLLNENIVDDVIEEIDSKMKLKGVSVFKEG